MMCFINIFCKMLDMWVGVGGGKVSTNSLPWIMQAHQCEMVTICVTCLNKASLQFVRLQFS